jgi:hypothetical protein
VSEAGESLAFHAAGPGGEGGYVLLLERRGGSDWLACRRWESPDYTRPADEERIAPADLRARVAREARDGWRFTVPVEHILAWLEHATSDPPAPAP